MSSLQSIMNLDDDQQDASSPMDKKDKDTTTPASGFRAQDPSRSIPTGSAPSRQHSTTVDHTTRPIHQQHHIDSDFGPSSPVQRALRPGEISTTTGSLPAPSSGYGDSRRQSSTSIDFMDPHGYGYPTSSSSSMAGGSGSAGYPPNVPRRPMGTSPGPEVPVRLTPITGRVSRAKKGVPVHVCDQCNPPKTFTRAEHLRRHQLSHQKPQYPCSFRDCNRTFYRQDLLSRHELRHTQEGGDPSSPRLSDTHSTLEEQTSGLSVGNPPRQNPYSPVPSSVSNPRPSTPPHGSSSRSAMSPMPEGHGHQYGLSPDHPSSNSFGYTLDSGMSVFHQPPNSLESSPEPSPFHGFESVPRTSPKPLLGLAQSLSPSISLRALVDPPELDYSWTSEDGHSTPSEMPRAQRHQPRPAMDWSNNALLAGAFPAEDRREIGSSGGVELMAAPYFLTAPFSVSPHLASVSQASYGPLFSEPMMSDFADEQVQLLDPAIIGHHGIHHGSPSVRSSSPSISISALGQAADTLVTPAPLHRVEPMARVSRQKELAMGGGTADMAMGVLGSEAMSSAWSGGSPGGSGIMAGQGLHGLHGANIGRMPALARPQAAVLNAVPAYIEIYWQHSHRSLPIVHRPSFEVASEDALRYAMAAMATQHLNTREDRIRGSQLHEYAWQEAKRCAPGNIQGMQAVFLCEYFARFRGRKTAVRPSKTFESLYSRVVDQCVHLFDTATALGGAGFGQQQAKTQLAASREERWRSWLNAEAHRRLLAACFCLDHHAAAYFQQPHARNDINLSEIPLTGSTGLLWEAKSVDDWCSILESQPAAANPQYLPPLDTLSPEDVLGYTMFDQGIILCATFWDLQNQLRAPPSNNEHADHGLREDFGTPTVASSAGELRKVDKLERAANLFSKSLVAPIADAYIALQHTPLHDLLAVSGDSWVFSQKVLGRTTFQEHQKRLKAWAEGRSSSSSPTMQQQQQAFGAASPTTAGLEGLSSAKATIYAARSLVSLLDGLHCQGPRPYVGCISTYWTIYVSALIIWAYGHHHRGGSKANNGSSSSSGSSGSPNKGTPMSHEETVTWLRMVADISQPEHLTRVRGRREASAGVVSMVKKMLETDCVGGRSRLYVDAAVVLRKLAEGVNWRWF